MRTAKTTPDGREIVDRKPNAKVPHPHPRHKGELVETQGVNEIMLADGTVLTECDDCGKPFENPRSAVAHRPSHNPARYGPRYPERTLRTIAREVAIAGGAQHRGALAAVAEILNERGVKMIKGGAWKANTVGHVYHKYCKDLRVRIPRTPQDPPTVIEGREPLSVAVLSELPAGDLTSAALLISSAAQELGTIGAQIIEGAQTLATVAQALAQMAAAPQVDPEVEEKARKWDRFKEMMGE